MTQFLYTREAWWYSMRRRTLQSTSKAVVNFGCRVAVGAGGVRRGRVSVGGRLRRLVLASIKYGDDPRKIYKFQSENEYRYYISQVKRPANTAPEARTKLATEIESEDREQGMPSLDSAASDERSKTALKKNFHIDSRSNKALDI
ncbi:hypothetical protein EVAR_3325_1 [Eumeta japonica]|uniref:Uncharacterized protein n=1 Tax=Eumeta variegata TaxID=151549 RepID=A0A4C1SY54_EUMVA|nr:hypothetical protein EVAR_3325_1 [Eumeta japonica]